MEVRTSTAIVYAWRPRWAPANPGRDAHSPLSSGPSPGWLKENRSYKTFQTRLFPSPETHFVWRASEFTRNFHFELPLHPKTYASYPVVSTANSSGLFEVVVRHILAVLRSRCAGFACPACLAADTYPARPLLSTYNYPLSWVASRLAAAVRWISSRVVVVRRCWPSMMNFCPFLSLMMMEPRK